VIDDLLWVSADPGCGKSVLPKSSASWRATFAALNEVISAASAYRVMMATSIIDASDDRSV
jgi:hypothetical protein